jgi:nicotinate-nucleotide adenylyltransferase
MKQVGLFFGSFNPVHMGHLILANYLTEETALEEVWFVITPQSPFKQNKRLLDNHHRWALVKEAIEDYPKLKSSSVEFDLPAPQYTDITMAHLMEQHSTLEFSLIMGADNLQYFHKWHNYENLLAQHKIYVYPRVLSSQDVSNTKVAAHDTFAKHPNIIYLEAPVVEISASYIRKAHKAGKNVRPFLPPAVWKYMDEMNFYR